MQKFSGMVISVLSAVSLLATVADASSDNIISNIATFNAHPAMFGNRWTTIVTANVKLVTADLCSVEEFNSTKSIFDALPDNNHSSISGTRSNNSSNDDHGIALYHHLLTDDETGEVECEYAYMAQVAQSMYPEARYLLFPYNRLISISNTQGIPNPDNLSIAVVTFEDGEEIQRAIGNLVNETSEDYVYKIRIDAVSRSIFDDETVLGDNRIELWVTLSRISSALSFFGSIYVIINLMGTKQRRRENLKSLFNRQLLAISVADVMSSIAIFTAAWASPSSPPGNFEGYLSQRRWDLLHPQASGNEAACAASGFFMQVGILGSSLFTGFFAIQALLVVRYAWKEETMKRLERFFFVVGVGFPLITGIWLTANRMMNPMSVGFCWISANPVECSFWFTSGTVIDEYCDTVLVGEGYLWYQIALANAWTFLVLVVVIYSMTSLYWFVRKQERRGSWWAYSNQDRKLEKKVFAKAIMYISVHLIIWIPTFLAVLGQTFSDGLDWANLFLCALLPSQGSFNALIYSGILEKGLQKISCCIPDHDSTTAGSRSFSMRYDGVIPSSALGSGSLSLKDEVAHPDCALEEESPGIGNRSLSDANHSIPDDSTQKTTNNWNTLKRLAMASISSISRSSRKEVKFEQKASDSRLEANAAETARDKRWEGSANRQCHSWVPLKAAMRQSSEQHSMANDSMGAVSEVSVLSVPFASQRTSSDEGEDETIAHSGL